MDIARASHNAQSRLKQVMTPLWTKEMGHRLRIAREKMLWNQAELARALETPGSPISQQQIADVESGRSERLKITWARLEARLGRHTSYVLIGAGAPLYNENLIRQRYFDYRQRAMRKRNGLDPKKGRIPPWPRTFSSRPLPSRKR